MRRLELRPVTICPRVLAERGASWQNAERVRIFGGEAANTVTQHAELYQEDLTAFGKRNVDHFICYHCEFGTNEFGVSDNDRAGIDRDRSRIDSTRPRPARPTQREAHQPNLPDMLPTSQV